MALYRTRQLTRHDVDALRDLTAAAAETDGIAPLSDDAVLRMSPDPLVHGQHLISTVPDVSDISDVPDLPGPRRIAGYAYLADHLDNTWQAELVVHPGQRRRGHGGRLLAALTGSADQAAARLNVWARGDPPAAVALAHRYGFGRERVLWQMRRPLSVLPGVELPAGVTIRLFVPGQDEEAWLAVNRAAFTGHPEQGRWTVTDLLLREAEPWFDPAGFFLAESAGRLAGFHWTKVHPAAAGRTAEPAMGEIYVVGLEPAFAGHGLGRALTLIGLHHLRDRGLATSMLYVDDVNQRAIRLYEDLGFTRYRADISYLREPVNSPLT
ncbi:mycothiol synthase [Frankia sp. Cj3]|uniref:mycothiol synthase n=1 Tax=Frankia sp. Cj3 TaxID=2880976 RepID=UPI001EF4D3B7|nr:mycothiol synthase [Frankia sp. Cj3]